MREVANVYLELERRFWRNQPGGISSRNVGVLVFPFESLGSLKMIVLEKDDRLTWRHGSLV
jgi:hypothetical protein